MKTKNTNKGITLIALIITIIVMLILVAVTISMAVNGGLFEYASNAGTQTNAAVDAEQEFANLEANVTVNQLIDKYTGWTGDNSQGGTIIFTINGVQYKAGVGMTWAQWIDSPEYEKETAGFVYGRMIGSIPRVYFDDKLGLHVVEVTHDGPVLDAVDPYSAITSGGSYRYYCNCP